MQGIYSPNPCGALEVTHDYNQIGENRGFWELLGILTQYWGSGKIALEHGHLRQRPNDVH